MHASTKRESALQHEDGTGQTNGQHITSTSRSAAAVSSTHHAYVGMATANNVGQTEH